jgi:hypothetical protein
VRAANFIGIAPGVRAKDPVNEQAVQIWITSHGEGLTATADLLKKLADSVKVEDPRDKVDVNVKP